MEKLLRYDKRKIYIELYLDIIMEVQTKTRRWGRSLGVVLPIDFVKKNKIKENQMISLEIKRKNIGEVFGSSKKVDKNLKEEILREIKEGWNDTF